MHPITLMPKFNIIQTKLVYGFTHEPLRSIISKHALSNSGFFYLLETPRPPIKRNDPPPNINAPVLVNNKITDTFMSSVQEYKTGSAFVNGNNYVPLFNALHEMVHIQGPTSIQFDNIVTNDVITDIIVQHISNAIDIHFYWICGRC